MPRERRERSVDDSRSPTRRPSRRRSESDDRGRRDAHHDDDSRRRRDDADRRRNDSDADGRREDGELRGVTAPVKADTEDAAIARPTRTGGTYVPPFKLAQMMRETRDKSSVEYQRMSWDALKKSINGLVNKVNASNVQHIVPELFRENLVRGRGLFARSVMKSQMASPQFSGIFAALVAVVNTKFPEIGELVIKRCILQFRRAYKRNDKPVCVAATRFLAALINQQVRISTPRLARAAFVCFAFFSLCVTKDEL